MGMPSFSLPSKLDTRTFLLTVSVREDISPECQEAIVKWARKNTHMNHIVLERGENAKLHLHAVLIFKDPRLSKKIHENVWDRFVKRYHSDSIGKYAVKVQVCPGNDWFNTYLQKESDVEVLSSNYDPAEAEAYFPTSEVQTVLMAQGGGESTPKNCNAWWDWIIDAWSKSDFPNEPAGALSQLSVMMDENKIRVMKDDRCLTDTAYALWRRRNKIVAPSPHQLMLLRRKDQDYSYECPGPVPVGGGAPGNSKKMWCAKDFSKDPSI